MGQINVMLTITCIALMAMTDARQVTVHKNFRKGNTCVTQVTWATHKIEEEKVPTKPWRIPVPGLEHLVFDYRLKRYNVTTNHFHNLTAECCYGFHGKPDNCEPCDSSHYGKDCAKECECHNGKCHPATGACRCNPGFVGKTCETCKHGFFGERCEGVCGCLWTSTKSCDARNGTCICEDGFRGANCSEHIPAATCSTPPMTTIPNNPIPISAIPNFEAGISGNKPIEPPAHGRGTSGGQFITPLGFWLLTVFILVVFIVGVLIGTKYFSKAVSSNDDDHRGSTYRDVSHADSAALSPISNRLAMSPEPSQHISHQHCKPVGKLCKLCSSEWNSSVSSSNHSRQAFVNPQNGRETICVEMNQFENPIPEPVVYEPPFVCMNVGSYMTSRRGDRTKFPSL